MIYIRPYTQLETELHAEIQKLVTSKKFKSIGADDMLLVFGRVYSVYALSTLVAEGKLKRVEKKLKKVKKK